MKRIVVWGTLIGAVIMNCIALAQAPVLNRMDIVERSTPAGPVATVDGNPVDREEYLFLYHAHLAAMTQGESSGNIKDSTRVRAGIAALGELIQREIIFQEAKKRGISIPDSEIRTALENEFKMLQEDLQRSGESAMSIEQLLERAGQSYEDAFEKMRKSLLVRRASEVIAREANVTVSDSEVQDFYQNNSEIFRQQGLIHLRQIFVKPKAQVVRQATEEQWAEARQTLEQALARIRAGESFEGVARAVSEAPNAAQGGDLGMLPAIQLPPFYLEAASRMRSGEISDIIRSEHGLHLILLVATEDEKNFTLEEAREEIRSYLLLNKQEDVLDDFVQPIITNQNRVKTYLQLERNLANTTELDDLWETP